MAGGLGQARAGVHGPAALGFQSRQEVQSLARRGNAISVARDGLAQLAQGQTDAAAQSFGAGSALERRNKPNVRDIGDALERIQGPARKELAKYRPM